MSTMWKSTRYDVLEVEVLKVTDHFVFFTNGRREALDVTDYYHWRNTKENAIAATLRDLDNSVTKAENMVVAYKQARDRFQEKFSALPKP